MTFVKKFMKFCSDNVVMITGITIIVGVHWTWSKLQNVPALVNPADKKEMPLILAARKLKEITENKYHELVDSESKKQ